MINEVILVGKLVKEPILNKTTSGLKVSNIILETVRHFKNSYGLYEHDFIEVTLWKGIAQTICDTCQIGSVIAVKGRIQPRSYLEENHKHYTNLEIIAEKVTILDAYFEKKMALD